jgi:hypothetical protein
MAAQNEMYSPRVTIQWRGIQRSDSYVVERLTGSGSSAVWEERRHINETGRGYYSFLSDPLEDAASHQFRVIALDYVGNESDPISFTMFMVRNPAPPVVSVSINSSGDLEVVSG